VVDVGGLDRRPDPGCNIESLAVGRHVVAARGDAVKVELPVVKLPWRTQIWKCSRAATARASRSKRWRREGSEAISGDKTLIATVRFSRVSRAR
jgi:hypothetical protein